MKLPCDVYSDEDDCRFQDAACEKKLYFAVFTRAFFDLIGDDKRLRDTAISWFKGRRESPVMYEEILEIFKFSDSRLRLIEECIKDKYAYRRTDGRKVRAVHRK